jgi:GNAT superfamily N-acetyltransferase
MDSRPATPQDALIVCSLLTQLGYPSSEGDVCGRLAELGDDDVVLLCEGGTGLVALHRVPRIAEGGSFARITALVVDEKHRGCGVGRALLEEAERVALSWGCSMLEVSAGKRPERRAAHALYSRSGYSDTAPRSKRYWKVLDPVANEALNREP